jgi:hypothetical protein
MAERENRQNDQAGKLEFGAKFASGKPDAIADFRLDVTIQRRKTQAFSTL